jgi:hypothetical protein
MRRGIEGNEGEESGSEEGEEGSSGEGKGEECGGDEGSGKTGEKNRKRTGKKQEEEKRGRKGTGESKRRETDEVGANPPTPSFQVERWKEGVGVTLSRASLGHGVLLPTSHNQNRTREKRSLLIGVLTSSSSLDSLGLVSTEPPAVTGFLRSPPSAPRSPRLPDFSLST